VCRIVHGEDQLSLGFAAVQLPQVGIVTGDHGQKDSHNCEKQCGDGEKSQAYCGAGSRSLHQWKMENLTSVPQNMQLVRGGLLRLLLMAYSPRYAVLICCIGVEWGNFMAEYT
jgi:hypothetical protein